MQPQDKRPARNLRRSLLILAATALVAGGLALLAFDYERAQAPDRPAASETPAALATPQRGQGLSGPQPPTATLAPKPAATPRPTGTPPAATASTMQTLDGARVPARDPYALAARLKFKDGRSLARTTARPSNDYRAGRRDVFNVSDIQNRNYYTVPATVRDVTEHAYWYVQDGHPVDGPALDNLTRAFEEKIYPTNRALFGSEWTPGVDNDPRITVLFAPLRGVGGSFSAADEYTRHVNPFSNEREMIYISTGSGWGGLEGTLAHEFQHMIHWHEHPNQDIWLNEGASVLASALNGYDVLGVDADFMRAPNVQLDAWEPSPTLARPNYGAAFLFLDYLMTHYGGEEVIRNVISAPEPGIGAVNTALKDLGYSANFRHVFENWVLANLLDDAPGASEELSYPKRHVRVSPEVSLDHYPTGYSGRVAQFGAVYVALAAPKDGTGRLRVDFSGQADTPIIPAPAHSGSAIWWSNRGDLSDATMTRSFDLSGLSRATLEYSAWFDIEQDFDYAYVEASTDGGAGWDTLRGKYTSTTNPNGTNYGNAYTGKSKDRQDADPGGWLRESIDLSQYAGKEVMLRFEYITDDGYNAQGFAVDDVSIPELGYSDDAEKDTGWQGEGFVRVDNKLPQSYYLAAVRFGEGKLDIRPIEVDASGEAGFSIDGLGAGGEYDRSVLVIAGLTPHNIQRTTFELSVRPEK